MKPVGYAWLLQKYDLKLPKLEVEYFQGDHTIGIQTMQYGDSVRKVLPSRIKFEGSPFAHVKLAIKY